MRKNSLSRLRIAILATVALAGAAESETALVAAARAGQTDTVAALLASGSSVAEVAADGATALHFAAEFGNAALAAQLVDAGADVSATTRNGATPLALAALNGHDDLIGLLLDAGADANAASAEGETALMLAAMNGRAEAVRILLEHGADPNLAETFRGQTALMWAAAAGNGEATQLLIDHGADVEARSNSGFSSLLFAVRNGELDALAVLIAAGANVNSLAPDGTSALNIALINGELDVAAQLLEHDVDPNLPDARGSPLHIIAWLREPGSTGTAAVGGEADAPVRPAGRISSIELARQLLAAGADPNLRIQIQESRFSKLGGTARNPPGLVMGRHLLTYSGATAFYIAAKNGDPELMRVLAEGGADPLLTTDFGITPLMGAAGLDTWEGETPGPHTGVPEAQRLEAVRLAIELGNDVNAVADFGDYPMEGTTEYTLLYYPHNLEPDLLNLGVGDPRWDESTALHGSIISGQASITQYLIDEGADPAAENALGWTPLNMSRGVFLANASREFPEAEAVILEALRARGLSAED